jgi:hypothetical protein
MPRLRVLLLAGLLTAVPSALPAVAQAETTEVKACVAAMDPPSSNSDTNWSVRVCGLPDFDQRRTVANSVGQPNPITVAGLPGDGGCHCVLTSIADIYAKLHAPIAGAATYATFDWSSRGTMPAPLNGTTYDTTSYSATEQQAYGQVTQILKKFGDVADVSYGQDAAHSGCGTSFTTLHAGLPKLATLFGKQVDDYAFSDTPTDANSAANMARALASGAGVAIAYGWYTSAGTNPATGTIPSAGRGGGHANAVIGVSRSGDNYTFEVSDPARSTEAGEDFLRQSDFATTTWSATLRTVHVKNASQDYSGPMYDLENTGRFYDYFAIVTPPRLVLRLPNIRRIGIAKLIAAKDLPRPPYDAKTSFTFEGPVLDAAFDPVTQRVIALVSSRAGRGLYAADAITGAISKLSTQLPAKAARLAVLSRGGVAVLGTTQVRTFDSGGDPASSANVRGADVAFDPTAEGVLVLRADGRRVLRYSSALTPKGGRSVTRPSSAASGPGAVRLTTSATGTPRLSPAAASGVQAAATGTGGSVQLSDGRVTTLLRSGATVPGRSLKIPSGSLLLDFSGGALATTMGDPNALIDAPTHPGD